MKYNNLTLLEEISKTHWRMRCDCGREVVTWKHDVLRNGWSTKRAFTQAPRISPSRTGVSS